MEWLDKTRQGQVGQG